jgi:DNA-directed RNA polymerase alpha subunit
VQIIDDEEVYYLCSKSMLFADRITNINVKDKMTTALFLSNDIAEINMFRRAILSEIDTYAIDIVVFQTNSSPRHDETIALRLGQLAIDHSRFIPPEEGNFKTHIDFQGPGQFNTNHIPGLPFKYVTPIAELRGNQRITCDVIVKKGQGKQHVKWRPVSTCEIEHREEGTLITIFDIGMLSGPEILEQGFIKIRDAARRIPITLFSHPLVPVNLNL